MVKPFKPSILVMKIKALLRRIEMDRVEQARDPAESSSAADGEIIFGDITTGASNDIERATKICRAMITQYGMSEKFGLMGLAETENQYLGGKAYLNCGDETDTEIDHEVMKMLKDSYEEAKRLLNENRDALDRLAGYLIIQETITGKEFMRILHTVFKEREQQAHSQKAEDAAEQQAPVQETEATQE